MRMHKDKRGNKRTLMTVRICMLFEKMRKKELVVREYVVKLAGAPKKGAQILKRRKLHMLCDFYSEPNIINKQTNSMV
jgi:hypothetical protein